MALKPVGSKGLLTINGIDLVKFVPELEAIQIATDNAIGNVSTGIAQGDASTLQAAKDDATGRFIPVWKANTAYTVGQRVINPSGDIVTAVSSFTSGATYSGTNWTASAQQTSITALEARTKPPTLSSTRDLDTWFTVGRTKTVTSGISGNAALHYPAGAVHGFLDVIEMGTGYYEQLWTDTWGGWVAVRRYYNSAWTAWARIGTAEANTVVAPIEQRVTALENGGGGTVQHQRSVNLASDYRPDAFAFDEGEVAYWTGPAGVERVGWGYRGEGYVGRIATAPGYTTMQIKKVQSNDEIEVSCLNPTTGRHITYRVQGSIVSLQDDQRRIEESWVGAYTGTTVSKDLLIMPRSNIEWAFQIDVGGNKQFAPYHGAGSAPATQYEPPAITDANGDPINIPGMAVNDVLTGVAGLKIRQRLYLTHPDSGATRWAAVDEVHTIAPDGMLQTEAVITFLRDTTIGSNYGPMTPVDQATFGTMKILGGSTYSVLTSPPATTQYLTVTEGHSATSALFTSSTAPSAFVAVTYLNPAGTLMIGDPLEETGALALRVEQRSGSGLTKLYPTVFDAGAVIPAGTIWRPSAQWRYGETTNPAQYA